MADITPPPGMSLADYYAALAGAGQNASAAASAAGNVAASNVTPEQRAADAASAAALARPTINVPGVGQATPQADGTYKVMSGPGSGLIVGANGQPDPKSLAQVQAAQKAQSLPGGLTSQGLTYSVNPDGTLTITGRTDGKPLPGTDAGGLNGATLSANGAYTKPDGTPVMAGNQPMFAPITPSGAPATDNPNFKGDKSSQLINAGINTVEDAVTKDNPIAGQVRAGVDIASGNTDKVKNDLTQGFSGGTAGVDANGNLTTGSAIKDAGSLADASGVSIPGLPTGLGSLLAPGSAIDSSAAKSDHDRAMSLADTLSGQANAAGAAAAGDRSQTDQTRAQQESSIQGLTDAANGAARQYGLAAALQGNNPAAALRQASLGSAAVAGTNNANTTALRATEQANARNALASTLSNVRAGDTGQQTTDVNQQTNLNNASATQSGQGVTSTGQQLTAQTEKEKADAAKTGALLGAGGTVLSTILSDPKAKKNIKKVGLADALGKGVTGVKYTYISPEDGPGEQFGVLADELEKVIPSTVKKREDGMRVVDTGKLSLSNTAILSELAKRIMELEKGKRK